ncbi:MAG: efflux RND transporter periplasmic adaptor subunit [Myxococcaceae bacterium]
MNRLLAVPLSILLASLQTTGCFAKKHSGEEHPELLTTQPLRTDTELTRPYVAQIRAIQHIEVRALERGYLQKVFVDEGQFVKTGQRMFLIMPTVYQAELEKAEAETQFVQIEYNNSKVLADGNVISPNELAMAKARLDKAKAEAALARVHRNLAEIRAPFDGLMDRFHVRLGSLLEEGELLTTLSDNSKMWVYFNVPEAEYLDYRSRLQGEGTISAQLVMANGQVFAHPGTVDTIEADFNNETGTIAFRATFPNPQGLLRHGQTGNVNLTKPLRNVLLVAQKATFEILDKKFVFVVDKDNVVHSREITVAEEMPQLYVVSSGLSENDRILLEGLRKVKDGDSISPKLLPPKQALAQLEVAAE